MFEYEMSIARRADLIREADAYRLLKDAKRARRSSRSQEPEGSVRGHRSRFTRAA
ncbi:hypothetical protein [Streptomyces sp. NPDC091268]|uniref:hypothetical protein n=1 Tax=Streptomyces sp. NPDC091268 TaxID=3365979 RepID=UPI003819E8B2